MSCGGLADHHLAVELLHEGNLVVFDFKYHFHPLQAFIGLGVFNAHGPTAARICPAPLSCTTRL